MNEWRRQPFLSAELQLMHREEIVEVEKSPFEENPSNDCFRGEWLVDAKISEWRFIYIYIYIHKYINTYIKCVYMVSKYLEYIP
jgi:hypothetical protein